MPDGVALIGFTGYARNPTSSAVIGKLLCWNPYRPRLGAVSKEVQEDTERQTTDHEHVDNHHGQWADADGTEVIDLDL